jgi:hypothetical protein
MLNLVVRRETARLLKVKIVIISADYTVLSGVAVPIATPNYTTALVSANCR